MADSILEVDLGSAVPAYEQIRAQVAGLISAGRLRPGGRLPTVRALAADLGLAVGTVNRAYRELEAEGAVLTRRRVGTVIAAGARPPSDALRGAAAVLVAQARADGLTDEQVLAAVRGALMPGSGVD